MDFHLKQWRNHQHESEQQQQQQQQHSVKIPKLLLEPHQQQQQQQQQQLQIQASTSALPLFVPEPNSKISSLSAYPDSTLATTRFPSKLVLFSSLLCDRNKLSKLKLLEVIGFNNLSSFSFDELWSLSFLSFLFFLCLLGMSSYFSLAQWQELELQALIYRYMLAGTTVPPELLQPIKKSLHISPYFLHHPLQHYPHFQPACKFSFLIKKYLPFNYLLLFFFGVNKFDPTWMHLNLNLFLEY